MYKNDSAFIFKCVIILMMLHVLLWVGIYFYFKNNGPIVSLNGTYSASKEK